MKKRVFSWAVALALLTWALTGAYPAGGILLAQPGDNPWWRPLSPFGQSAGVTYGTIPSTAPAQGEVMVDTDGGSDGGPVLQLYDGINGTWDVLVAVAAGGMTNDTIPVWNAGAGAFEDSLLTDDGTDITQTAGQLLAQVGTAAAPSYSFTGNTGTGMTALFASVLDFNTGGATRMRVTTTQVGISLAGSAATPTLVMGGDVDSGFYSGGADIVGISTGGTAALQMSVDGILPRTYTFATLPASANGNIVYCSDCTAGGTPCAGLGNGSIAFRLNGAWECTL